MLRLFRAWRERDWQEISAAKYGELFAAHGGSVMTHPDIVRHLSDLAGIPVRYLGLANDGMPLGGIATWDRHIALSRQALKRFRKREFFDLGNAEIILPISQAAAPCAVRFQMRYVSALHAGKISNLRPQQESLALARPPEDYSKKFLYNQRRELRVFQESGGRVRDILEFSADELAAAYIDLFARRWGFPAPAKAHLPKVLTVMRPFMFGSLLQHDDRVIALQLLYRVESPGWISVEYINGGVDPQFQKLSPGSILTYINTQAAWANARMAGKSLRYSFGRADTGYKSRWCHTVPVFET